MIKNWIYPYPNLETGILLRRYKRFFADIQLTSGEVITAHCPNTGPMTGVSTAGSLVKVSHSNNPKRKLLYTWEMIQVNDNQPTWVGVNTGLPNRVIKLALEQGLIPELGSSYKKIRCEFPYGKEQKSRVDFLLTSEASEELAAATLGMSALLQSTEPSERPIYLEVKSVTLAQGNLALFPDTVTTRGQKHLRELMLLPPHARAVMLYFINRGDCTHFAPCDRADLVYGQLLREAVAQALRCCPAALKLRPKKFAIWGWLSFCRFNHQPFPLLILIVAAHYLIKVNESDD